MSWNRLLVGISILFLVGISFAYEGYIYNGEDGSIVTKLYADPSSGNLYVESGVNPDVGAYITDTDVSGKYIALVYGINVSGDIVSYAYAISKSGTQVMALTNDTGYVLPSDFTLIDFTVNDVVKNRQAGMPGRPWFVISNDRYLNNTDIFLVPNGGLGLTLVGRYIFNDYVHAYDPVTGNVNITVLDIKVTTRDQNGNLQESGYLPSLENAEVLAMGTCEDDYGFNCSDGTLIAPYDAKQGIILNTGHTGITDQNPHKMYLVVNGMSYPLDLGADLVVTKIDAPSPIYYGQNFTVNVTVQNVGNVNVTHPFNVTLTFWRNVGGTSYSNVTLTQMYNATTNPLEPLETVTLQFKYQAKPNGSDAFASTGTLTLVAYADANNTINETNENNNQNNTTIDYEPAYIPIIEIDGNQTYNFPYSGQPYNVTFSFQKMPDNIISSSFSFKLVKKGGINLFVPLQAGSNGITSAKTEIDISYSSGSITIPIIPTKTGVGEYGSDEVIYITSPGKKFYDNRTGNVVDIFYLNITNTSYQGANETTKSGIVDDYIISSLFTKIYKIYAVIIKIIQG